jgi:hypothetical protein
LYVVKNLINVRYFTKLPLPQPPVKVRCSGSATVRNTRGKSASLRLARMIGSSARRKRGPWRTAMRRSSTDLIEDAGALAHSIADPMQRLQIELLGGLGGDELHGGRCTASAIASASRKSFFYPFKYGRTCRGHQPSVVTECLQRATDNEMVGANAGLHADQAQSDRLASRAFTLPRPFLPQIAPRLSRPTRWNEFLLISMPINAIALLSLCDRLCSLTLAPPANFSLWRDWSTSRTIPLADLPALPVGD